MLSLPLPMLRAPRTHLATAAALPELHVAGWQLLPPSPLPPPLTKPLVLEVQALEPPQGPPLALLMWCGWVWLPVLLPPLVLARAAALRAGQSLWVSQPAAPPGLRWVWQQLAVVVLQTAREPQARLLPLQTLG